MEFIAAIFLLVLIISIEAKVLMETSKYKILHANNKFTQHERADENTIHEVIFAIKQNNFDYLKSKLFDISNPNSNNYRNYMTHVEIGALSANPIATDVILNHLQSIGATITYKSRYGEYIHTTATIKQWEQLFSTTFHSFHHIESGKTVTRAHEYFLPSDLAQHISTVHHVIHFPIIKKHELVIRKNKDMSTKNYLNYNRYILQYYIL